MCRGIYGRVWQELTQWGKQNKNKTNSYSAEQLKVILCLKITQQTPLWAANMLQHRMKEPQPVQVTEAKLNNIIHWYYYACISNT